MSKKRTPAKKAPAKKAAARPTRPQADEQPAPHEHDPWRRPVDVDALPAPDPSTNTIP